MTQVSIEEVVAKLQSLLNEVLEGREILITQDNRPVAKLVSVKGRRVRRKFGSAKGMITILSDFYLPLSDMAEYS